MILPFCCSMSVSQSLNGFAGFDCLQYAKGKTTHSSLRLYQRKSETAGFRLCTWQVTSVWRCSCNRYGNKFRPRQVVTLWCFPTPHHVALTSTSKPVRNVSFVDCIFAWWSFLHGWWLHDHKHFSLFVFACVYHVCVSVLKKIYTHEEWSCPNFNHLFTV